MTDPRAFAVGSGAAMLACGLLEWAGVTGDWNLWLSVAVFAAAWLGWGWKLRREGEDGDSRRKC